MKISGFDHYAFVMLFNGERTGRTFSTDSRAAFDRELRRLAMAGEGWGVLVLSASEGRTETVTGDYYVLTGRSVESSYPMVSAVSR